MSIFEAAEQDRLAGRRVLIVEDEVLVCMLLEDMLETLGCTLVGPASRLDKALQLAREASIDSAILDVNLAGQEVYPVAEALAARGIPFVFATGYGTTGLRAPYQDSPTLQKPFSQDDLQRVLGESLVQAER